jgi:hypothetical protein
MIGDDARRVDSVMRGNRVRTGSSVVTFPAWEWKPPRRGRRPGKKYMATVNKLFGSPNGKTR